MDNPHSLYDEQNFYQPIDGLLRELDGNREIVSFLGGSTVRVWHNNLAMNYENHWHTATEIILPAENSYTVIVNQTTYHLNVGDILVIPPGEQHELIAPASGSRFIYMFDISAISKLKGFTAILPLLVQPLLLTPKTYPKIYEREYNLLLQIRNEYFAVNNLRELIIYSLIINFYVEIGRNHYESDFQNPYTRPDRQKEYIDKFNGVLDYIDNHYAEDLTLEAVAQNAGFSKYHFSRLFKQYTDSTFNDYLCYKRIKIAQDLLSRPNLSVTEVALQAGFSTISTFNRIFKQLIGCTPTNYRQLHMVYHNTKEVI